MDAETKSYQKLGLVILLLGIADTDTKGDIPIRTSRQLSDYETDLITNDAREWVASKQFTHLANLCGFNATKLRSMPPKQARQLLTEVRK